MDRSHCRVGPANDKCFCGLVSNKCEVMIAIDPMVDRLYRWEAGQVERFDEGKEHGLPREHPKVTGSGVWRTRLNY